MSAAHILQDGRLPLKLAVDQIACMHPASGWFGQVSTSKRRRKTGKRPEEMMPKLDAPPAGKSNKFVYDTSRGAVKPLTTHQWYTDTASLGVQARLASTVAHRSGRSLCRSRRTPDCSTQMELYLQRLRTPGHAPRCGHPGARLVFAYDYLGCEEPKRMFIPSRGGRVPYGRWRTTVRPINVPALPYIPDPMPRSALRSPYRMHPIVCVLFMQKHGRHAQQTQGLLAGGQRKSSSDLAL